MPFFTDPTPYTHRARFYGFPAYYREDGPDGCHLAGTNVIWDWCIVHVSPRLHWLVDCIGQTFGREPLGGWMIELRGELPRRDNP